MSISSVLMDLNLCFSIDCLSKKACVFASFLEFALTVFCMYVSMVHVYHVPFTYFLPTYVGPGRVEIVVVKVFVEEERSQMKVALRKVRLLL